MRITHALERTSRRFSCITLLLLAAALQAAHAGDDFWITGISPDGRFALRSWYDGSRKAEVVSLAAGKKKNQAVAEIEHTAQAPLASLNWSPDSQRFAYAHAENQRFTVLLVYERAGDTFRRVKLPQVPVETPAKPAGWTFREKGDSVWPVRWLDPSTLQLRTWVYGYLNDKSGNGDADDASGWAKLHFPKIGQAGPPKVLSHGGRPTVMTAAVTRLAGDPRLHDLLSLDVDTLDVQWSPDQSAALIVQANSGDECKAAQLVELSKGSVARSTDLRAKLTEALTADFLKEGPKESKSVPTFDHHWEDWRIVNADTVAVECQVVADLPHTGEEWWSARLDGVWKIKEARWGQLKFQHYRVP